MRQNNTANSAGQIRKVGVYVRVSSEVQGEKASPELQEADAKRYAEQRGYVVVDVYRDVTKYRVNGKGKLVEPSGTRVDRPEYQRMVADARAGRINTIIAWREDRLYRGIRPMLEVLEMLDDMKGHVTVELVTETFDMAMAPIKAAIARMELSTKNERWTLGMRGRLAAGKSFAPNPYGYHYDEKTGLFYIYEEEAQWVRFIYSLYADGYALVEISRELIKRGAPQRMVNGGKSPWSASVIYRVLRHEYYYTGKKTTRIGEQEFVTQIEPLIDEETWVRCQRRIEGQKTYSNAKKKTYSTEWLSGLLICAGHGYHMGQLASLKGPAPYEAYACRNKYRHQLVDHPNCGGSVSMGWLDRYVWNTLFNFIGNRDLFETRLQERMNQLRAKQDNARQNMDMLQSRFDQMEMERVRVRTMFRKNHISEEEMDQDMHLIEQEQEALAAEIALANTDYTSDLNAVQDLARLYRTKLANGVQNLEFEPTDLEGFRKWSDTIRRIIRALVSEVTIDNEWKVEIKTHMDITKSLYNGRPQNTGIFVAVEESGWQET